MLQGEDSWKQQSKILFCASASVNVQKYLPYVKLVGSFHIGNGGSILDNDVIWVAQLNME